jgi:hypothetical protein
MRETRSVRKSKRERDKEREGIKKEDKRLNYG